MIQLTGQAAQALQDKIDSVNECILGSNDRRLREAADELVEAVEGIMLHAGIRPPSDAEVDLDELRVLRMVASQDKSDLFDFYNRHWDGVIDEIRSLRSKVEKLEDDLTEMQQRDIDD